MEVLFPFGHRLSYTQFEYSNLVISQKEMTEEDKVTVSLDVQNVGNREGKEVIQFYVSDETCSTVELLSGEKTAEYTRTTILPYNEMFAAGNNEDMQEIMEAMAKYMPLRALRSFSKMTNEDINKIVEELNNMQ